MGVKHLVGLGWVVHLSSHSFQKYRAPLIPALPVLFPRGYLVRVSPWHGEEMRRSLVAYTVDWGRCSEGLVG